MGRNSLIPPEFGNNDTLPLREASQSNVGCPS